MSEYTTTPNLGLFKPNYDMDDGQWGFHLNTNADVLDALLGSGGLPSGPWLPLKGGTVSGTVSIGADQPNHITLAGGAAGSPATITTPSGSNGSLAIVPDLQGGLHINLWRSYPDAAATQPELCRFDYLMQGTNSSSGNSAGYSAEVHSINADTVAGSGAGYFSFLGGPQAGAGGGRTGLGIHFQQSGATTIGSGNFYVGNATGVYAAHNGGGASATPMGGVFASNDIVILQNGATYWEEVCGYELDVGTETGATCSSKHGMKVNLWASDAVSGTKGKDSAYSTSATATTGPTSGWDVGFAVGDCYGYWPMKTTGTIIGTVVGNTTGAPAFACAWGIDFSAVTFSGGLIRGPGGVSWTMGSAAPASVQPVGSLYSRTGGAVGATLYVSRGGGTWAAVAGV
jgi:hypothetical protein